MTRPALLALSLLALAAGPLLAQVAAASRARLSRALLVAVVALVLLKIGPEAWHVLGPVALLLSAIGWALPTATERLRHRPTAHAGPRVLVALGMIGHSTLDGAAIGAPTTDAVGWAVVLHQVPAAAASWLLLAPSWGKPAAGAVLALTGVATVGGYVLAGNLERLHDVPLTAALSAFVAGAVLHLATHGGHEHQHEHEHEHEHKHEHERARP